MQYDYHTFTFFHALTFSIIKLSASIKHALAFLLSGIFSSLISDLDDITMTVGGRVKLKLVFGDITNETVDAVVNTTDFTNFQTGG